MVTYGLSPDHFTFDVLSWLKMTLPLTLGIIPMVASHGQMDILTMEILNSCHGPVKNFWTLSMTPKNCGRLTPTPN